MIKEFLKILFFIAVIIIAIAILFWLANFVIQLVNEIKKIPALETKITNLEYAISQIVNFLNSNVKKYEK